MTPRVKPPNTLVSVLYWLRYCRATALSALANLTLLLGKNTLPFPAFGNLNFVSLPPVNHNIGAASACSSARSVQNDWSSSVFLPGCASVHLPTITPRVKPPHTLVSVLHWLWYCRATALYWYALANLTLLLGKNTLPFPAFGNLNFVSRPHRRAYTSIPKSCPNIRFPYQQDFFPIRSVTKSSTAVEKIKIFVQDFVPIRTALSEISLQLESC